MSPLISGPSSPYPPAQRSSTSPFSWLRWSVWCGSSARSSESWTLCRPVPRSSLRGCLVACASSLLRRLLLLCAVCSQWCCLRRWCCIIGNTTRRNTMSTVSACSIVLRSIGLWKGVSGKNYYELHTALMDLKGSMKRCFQRWCRMQQDNTMSTVSAYLLRHCLQSCVASLQHHNVTVSVFRNTCSPIQWNLYIGTIEYRCNYGNVCVFKWDWYLIHIQKTCPINFHTSLLWGSSLVSHHYTYI